MPAVLDAPAAPAAATRPAAPPAFGGTDRRQNFAAAAAHTVERRQFGSFAATGRPEVDELAQAVDRYKLENRRRFITYAELYDVFVGLGYDRN